MYDSQTRTSQAVVKDKCRVHSQRRTHNIDQLGKAQSHLDGEAIAVISNGSDETVVVRQEVVVKALRFRIGRRAREHSSEAGNGRRHRQKSA